MALIHAYPEDEQDQHDVSEVTDGCHCSPVVSLMFPPDTWVVSHTMLGEDA